MTENNLLSLTPAALEKVLHLKKGNAYWVKLIYRAIYGDLLEGDSFGKILRPDIIKRLGACKLLFPLVVRQQQDPQDGTIKWLYALADGAAVETVLMTFARRSSLCLSTQCGCGQACEFCATGRLGLIRDLTAGEMVAQALLAQKYLQNSGEKLTNVVFMGMGEPFDNYEASMTAAEILSADIGLAIAPRHITISTVGIPEKIRQFAAEKRGYQLAVSLHSALQEKRAALMPAARRYPLDELLAACQEYNRLTKRRVFFEYALLRGVNDSPDDIAALAAFVRQLDGHVNLLAWNELTDSPFKTVTPEALLRVQDELTKLGVRALIRDSRGNNIAAACGMLYGS